MSRRALIKVYAAFSNANEASRLAVEEAGGQAIGNENEWLFLEGDLLRLSWEGLFFPLEEVLLALAATLPPQSDGKLDYLDLENWTLTRNVLSHSRESSDGPFSQSTRSLNSVLDYSGH